MIRFYLSQATTNYLEEVQKDNDLGSVSKALNFVIQEHKKHCTVTTNSIK